MSVREENIRLRIQATSELPVVADQYNELIKLTRLLAQQIAIQTGEQRAQSEAQIKAISGVTDALGKQRSAVKQSDDELKNVDKTFDKINRQVRDFATLVGTAFTINEIKNFGMDVIDAKTRIDSLKISLDVMLGSKKESTVLFNDIVALAKKTPFSLDEVAENVVKLKAYNIATKDLIPTVEALGNMAAAVGKDKLPQLTLAYGQVMNLGKLMGTETRQFVEAGIPLYDLLADSMKKPKEEVIKLAQAHQIMASDVQKAIMQTSEVGGRYYNMMQLQSKTLGGQVSNLADTFFVAKARIGDFFEDELKAGIKTTGDLITALMGSDSAIKRTTTTITAIISAFTTWRLATIAQNTASTALTAVKATAQVVYGAYLLIVQRVTTQQNTLTAAQLAATTATRGLWAALSANPLGLIVSIIGTVITGILALDAATQDVTATMGEMEYQVKKEQSELMGLAQRAMSAAEGTSLRKDALDLLIAKYPEYFRGLDSEKTSNSQLKMILDQVNISYQERINLARDAYRIESLTTKQRELFEKEAALIAKLPQDVQNMIGGSLKNLLEMWQGGMIEGSKAFRNESRSLMDQVFGLNRQISLETINEIVTGQEKIQYELGKSAEKIKAQKEKERIAEIGQINATAEALRQQAQGNSEKIIKINADEKAAIAKANGEHREQEFAATNSATEKKKVQVSNEAIEIMKIKSRAGERSLEDQLKLLEAEQKIRIDAINKLEISEKEKAKRIEKVVLETQPKIDALKADLQLKSVSATNIAIEKMEAESGERSLKQQMQLLDKKEQSEIETINRSKIAYEEKEKQIKAIIDKYEPDHKALRLKYEEIKNQELIQAQNKHQDAIKVLTAQRLEAETILERISSAKTQEERLALIKEYGKKATDEVKEQALVQLKINLDAAQKHLDQVTITEKGKGEVYEKALKQRNEAEAKYETARTQQQVKSASEGVELINSTEEKIRHIRQETYELEKQNIEKDREFRNNAIKQIMDLYGQTNPIVAQFGQGILTVINNLDLLTGKSREKAQQQVTDYQNTLTQLEELDKQSAGRTQAQIEETKVKIGETKKLIANAKAELKDTEKLSFDTTMSIVAMAVQILQTVVNAINESIAATFQAIADAYGRIRDMTTDYYDSMREANRNALDLELANYQGTYAQKEQIIHAFYEEEKRIAEGKDKLDLQLWYAQRVAQINADAGTNIKKFLQDMEQLQRERIQKESEMEIAGVQQKLEQAERLKDMKIEYLKQEMEAFKQAKELEISEAEKARDAKADLLKTELDNFKAAKQAETDELNKQLAAQKEATNQFYSDKQLRLQEDTIYRSQLLAEGEAREVAALEAAKQRELARASSADERTQILNAFEKLIADKHAEYQTAIGDKTKEISLANQEAKAQEADKIKGLEKETADAVSVLKDQMAAKDKETQELIKKNQEETAAVINALKDQIAAKDKETSEQIKAENRSYAKLRIELEFEILDIKKQTMIAEMRAEQALLRSKRWFINKNRINDAINEIEEQINSLNGTGGRSEVIEKMEHQEQLTAEIESLKQQKAQFDQKLQEQQSKIREKQNQVNAAESSGQDATSLKNDLATLKADEEVIKKWINATINDIVAREEELKRIGFVTGTEFVDREGNHANGIDTVPAMLTRGERVLTVDQNQALGGIGNEELVNRSKFFEKLASEYPKLMNPIDWKSIASMQIGLPADVLSGNSGGAVFDVSGLRDDLASVRQAIESNQRAVEKKELLQIQIDKNGFATALVGAQSKTNYYQNLLSR
ncbi:tape measure protein [Larkinella rosea]|uniref:Tape measure protein N-terminal domain-containing protein n=1 Tax=Larkinella rosea TaxID=2025312 RepID=A0A3P1BYX0_9BACT|nr:tape measure protein [Larkinella rosea]RRB06285.1 hypothetical protein EHT25_00320 [Larkinella rosea]